jgi:hypothetical protein
MDRWFRSAILSFCLWIIGVNVPAGAAVLACSPDLPVVETGDSVTLRAFTDLAGAADYTWKANVGSIVSKAAEARWNFDGVLPGIYEARVQLKGDSWGGVCRIRMVITEKSRNGSYRRLEPGAGFLTPNQREGRGYGLYSYLLLGAAPVESNRQRYVETVAAYLRLVPRMEELKRNIRLLEINATYLPLQIAAPKDVSVTWVLEHYDYGRARAILRLIPGGAREGPYFVSSNAPLTGADAIPAHHLLQDLSAVPVVPKDLPAWWVREFMSQSAQERYWDAANLEQFTLKLRTTLAILSVGLPEVQASIKDWITWSK